MSIELRALALALLARRRRTPVVCTLPPDMRDDVARRTVADYVGGPDFKRFVEKAAAGRLPVDDAVSWAILTPALRRTTGLHSRKMPLFAWAAGHIMRHHGPQAGNEKAWKRLQWPDWLLAQRVIDEVTPELQPDGRWRFDSGPLLQLHRPVGFRLIAEGREGVLTLQSPTSASGCECPGTIRRCPRPGSAPGLQPPAGR